MAGRIEEENNKHERMPNTQAAIAQVAIAQLFEALKKGDFQSKWEQLKRFREQASAGTLRQPSRPLASSGSRAGDGSGAQWFQPLIEQLQYWQFCDQAPSRPAAEPPLTSETLRPAEAQDLAAQDCLEPQDQKPQDQKPQDWADQALENQWFLIRALSQFNHPQVIEAIAQLLVTTAEVDLQQEAVKALTGFGNASLTALSRLLEAAQPLAQRRLAARVLAMIRRSETISPLLSVAQEADPQLRLIATEALGSFHDRRIAPVLIEALKDQADICIEALRALGRRRDLLSDPQNGPSLLRALERCLHSETLTVASESAIALGRLGSEATIDILGQGLSQPIPSAVKMAVIRALGWQDSEQAVGYLLEAFVRQPPEMMPALKPEIVRSLGQTRTASAKAQAAQGLIGWLKHDYPTQAGSEALIQGVLSALSQLQVTEAVEPLIPLLAAPDLRIRLHALSALKQIDALWAQTKIQIYLNDPQLDPKHHQIIADSLAAW